MPLRVSLRPSLLLGALAILACTSENSAGLVVAVSVEGAQAARVKRIDLRRVDSTGLVLSQRTETRFDGRCARRDGRGLMLFAFAVGEDASVARIVSTAYADEAGRQLLSEMRIVAPVGRSGHMLADLFLDFACGAEISACTHEQCALSAIPCMRRLDEADLHAIASQWSRDDLCDAGSPHETVQHDSGPSRDALPDTGRETSADTGPSCTGTSCSPCAEAGTCPETEGGTQACTTAADAVCIQAHVENPYCEAGHCRGTCEPGWGDCDEDLSLNGCETDLTQSDQHCGACSGPNVVCDYPGACTYGECLTYRFGHLTGSGSTVLRWPAHTFAGMAVMTGLDTKLVGVGLGTVVDTLHPPVRIRAGVYEEVNGQPGRLIAETLVFTSDALQSNHPDALAGDVALELRVTQPVPLLAQKPYWIVMIADGDLHLRSESYPDLWMHGASSLPFADLGHMPGSFQRVTTFTASNTIAAAVLYGVAVPRR